MRPTRMLAVFLAAGLVLAACGDDDSTTTAQDDESTTTTTAGDTGADDAAVGDVTLEVATNDELGEYLVDADGRTVYLFEKDDGTTTACTGGCADNWPPLVAVGTPTGGDGIDAAELATAEGIEANQVVYHGHLLYYFAGDSAAGDTNGTAVPSWYAVSPDGEEIELD